MEIDQSLLKRLALNLSEILIPISEINRETWSVNACDQHTSNPEYWERVADLRRGNPSTYDLILPEAYLSGDDEECINTIQKTMKNYLQKKYFYSKKQGLVYIQRYTQLSGLRQGIIASIDLEQYEFSPDRKSLIRATEKIIPERILPRKKIRQNAELELSHSILLIADKKQHVIESLKHKTQIMEKIYDFELMMNGGQLKGYWLDDPETINTMLQNLSQLPIDETTSPDSPFLFAVGDGNHSLAAAKELWEDIRDNQLTNDPEKRENHPARYAMVEIINIYNSGISLESINRCLFNIDPNDFFALLTERKIPYKQVLSDFKEALSWHQNGALMYSQKKWYLIENFGEGLICETIDRLLDTCQKTYPGTKIDYIHGWDHTRELADASADRVSIFFNPLRHEELFALVAKHGVLPRKAFSIGTTEEKRYYFEARRIQ